MRQFKYKGGPVSMGHLGRLDKGDGVTLSEQDAKSVEGNVDFVLLRESPVEGFPEEPGLPPDGQYFKLSTLRWKSIRIYRDVNRLRRTKLTLAVQQLEASGFPVPPVDYHTEVQVLRDVILTTGRLADWI